jgi:hypothetical protein
VHDYQAESRRLAFSSRYRSAGPISAAHKRIASMTMLKDPSKKYRAFPTIDLPDHLAVEDHHPGADLVQLRPA